MVHSRLDIQVMGKVGAINIASTLKRQGVDKLHFVLDEGMLVLKDMLPGVEQNIIS